jgi:hypothetical protein
VNQETQEDLTILAALDAPDGGLGALGTDETGERDETAQTLARLYTEMLGLIPCELEPQATRPEVKQRLMAMLAEGADVAGVADVADVADGDETQEMSGALAPAPEPALPPASARPSQPAQPFPPSQETRSPRPAPYALKPAPRPARRWPLALAACLALIFAGLSGVLGYLVNEQRDRMASLERELTEARSGDAARTRQMEEEMRQARTEMAEMRQMFSMVTGPAAQVVVLRPPAGAPAPQPTAAGNLFVAADHQHWYLTVQGLAEAGPGRRYQLWWDTPAGMVSGGTLEVQPGRPVTLSSPTMPGDTRGAMVTMEPAGVSPVAPTGPEVLRSANTFQLS